MSLLKNRYQILEVLSEAGGFGQTFLAEDTDTPSRRKCVIKKLRPIADKEDFKFVQERFQREAAILETLGDSSDQIPKLYAYFVENQEFYLVQELIDGLTLKQKVQREGVLNENTVKELLLSLLTVLDYIHKQNIIHRDIKPDNIILRQRDNKPVLIDFGIVKEVLRVGVDGSPTSSMMAGTPGYTASEQAAGRPVYASDVYSLGATAIYLLTGRNPQQMTDLANGDIVWRQFAPQVGSSFAGILNKATESHPRERYKTTAEMREDLQSVVRDESLVSAKPLSPIIEEKTVVRPILTQPQTISETEQYVNEQRKKLSSVVFGIARILIIIGAGFLLIIGVVALFSYLSNQSREKVQIANIQNSNINRNTSNAAISRNTSLLNSNSATINSNIQTSLNTANVNAANADIVSSLDKAQGQKLMDKYISVSLKKEGLEAGEKTHVYGDLDDDGDEDAAVQADWVYSTGGNGYGSILFVFRNENGNLKFADSKAVGNDLDRNFYLAQISSGKIYGNIETCRNDLAKIGLCEKKDIKKGRTQYSLQGNKLAER